MRVGLLFHAPLSPAGVLGITPQRSVAHFEEYRAGRDRRRRRAAKQCLRVLAVCDHVFQGTGLIVSVFLRFVDHQQIETFTQTALGRAGAELDAARAIFQLDVLTAHRLNGFVRDLCFIQQMAQALPCCARGGGAVRGVQDAFALLQAV